MNCVRRCVVDNLVTCVRLVIRSGHVVHRLTRVPSVVHGRCWLLTILVPMPPRSVSNNIVFRRVTSGLSIGSPVS